MRNAKINSNDNAHKRGSPSLFGPVMGSLLFGIGSLAMALGFEAAADKFALSHGDWAPLLRLTFYYFILPGALIVTKCFPEETSRYPADAWVSVSMMATSAIIYAGLFLAVALFVRWSNEV